MQLGYVRNVMFLIIGLLYNFQNTTKQGDKQPDF